ncbi:hypothetical protein BYT27DRAFT_6686698, partial [Phlegmacium glaucopus]
MLIQLTLSRAENQGQLGSVFPRLSSSLQSFAPASFMSRVHYPFKPATCVVERPVGGSRSSDSVPPRPIRPRNLLFPFKRTFPTNTTSPNHTSTSPIVPITLPHRVTMTPAPPDLLLPASHPPNPSLRPICPRIPQTGRHIAPNILRPHVAAANRLFSWDTPYGTRHRNLLYACLPQPLVDSALMSIQGALAPNTRSTYAAGLKRFTQFCDKWGIAEEARMPASYALICAFIGEHRGRYAGST